MLILASVLRGFAMIMSIITVLNCMIMSVITVLYYTAMIMSVNTVLYCIALIMSIIIQMSSGLASLRF